MATSPFALIKFRLYFVGAWVVWALLHAAVLYWFNLSVETAILDSLVSNTLLAGACWFISSNLQYYQPDQARLLYFGIWCLLLSGLWMLVLQYMLPLIIENNPEHKIFLNNSLPVRFGIGFLTIGWMVMLSVLWYSQQEQKQSEQRQADAEKLAREAELFKLRQQLQPHFLFNSLNSVNALIGSRPQEARRMVLQLSDFLRGTLKREEHQWVTLTEELEHLRLYLEIEKVRFGHRLATEIIADEECGNLRLPSMLLQPLVENAIKFGLYDTTDEVIIRLQAHCQPDMLEISVQNPYDPHTAQPRQGTGFGLSGVQRRLYLLFARTDLLQTFADNTTYTTLVKIPQLP
ncbi:MAG: sensor histidine kinase [Adhaeribacter sp.]